MEALYRLEFEIPGLPKMTNSKRSFGHWAQYHREAVKWKKSFLPYLLSKRPKTALKKAKLTLVRGSSVEPDFDGLVSSFKHLIDGLVEARILENDRSENIGQPNYLWEKAGAGKGFVRITIEELRP